MSQAPYRLPLPVVVTLGVGLALSVVAGSALRSWEWHKLRSDFARGAAERARTVLEDVHDCQLQIDLLAGLYGASREVERAEFREFLKPVLGRKWGIQAFEWVPRVSDAERAAYEAQVRAEGLADFQIMELAEDGTRRVAGRRPEYFPVTSAQPAVGNEAALGLDLASSPPRREMLERAAASGETTLSGRVRLVQETGEPTGICIARAVYAPAAAIDSAAGRRATLAGFVVAVLRVGDLVEGALASVPPADITCSVEDASAAASDQLLYGPPSHVQPAASVNATAPPRPPDLQQTAAFEVGGRTWRIVCRPAPGFAAAGLTWLPYGTLLGGVLCTVLLARYLQRSVQRSNALAREVAERSNLEASRRLLNTAVECAANAVMITDFQGNIVWVNRAFTTLTGYAKAEVLGAQPRLLRSGLHDASFYTGLLETIHAKQIWHGQLVNRRKDGSLYTEEMTITPVLDEDGGIRNFVAIKQDVTERENAQHKLTCVQAAVDDAGDAILMLDSHGTATYVNVAFTVLFRHTLESINEQGWESVFARPAIGAEILEASTYLDPWAGEAEMVARGGHAFPAEVRAAPIIGKGTLSAGTMLFICDITERKRAETALAESEERHRAITACARDAIVTADSSGRILFWNSAAEQIFGYTAAEVVGRNLIECIVPPQYHAVTLTGLAGIAQTGPGATVGKTLELTALRQDGTEFPIEAAVSSYRDQRGFVGVAVVRDITDRQRAEADRLLQLAVEKERDHLRDALLAQERVVGVVGHELRSPLAALRATAEFLLQDGAKELAEFDAFLRALNDEIVRMADLVNDLVEVARLNSGTARWNWSDFALADVCEQALDSIRPLLSGGGVRLHRVITPPAAHMRGDASAIRRLLVNLLSNAYKHTTQGEISVRITRTRRDACDWVALCVGDTGTGIAPEVASRLGIAFALNSGVVGESHVNGSGLGLAICKGIAAAHAGRIRVETALGKGTVITVTLRADLPEAAAAADDGSISCGALL